MIVELNNMKIINRHSNVCREFVKMHSDGVAPFCDINKRIVGNLSVKGFLKYAGWIVEVDQGNIEFIRYSKEVLHTSAGEMFTRLAKFFPPGASVRVIEDTSPGFEWLFSYGDTAKLPYEYSPNEKGMVYESCKSPCDMKDFYAQS